MPFETASQGCRQHRAVPNAASATVLDAVSRGFMCLVLHFPWMLTPSVRCIADIIEMQAVDRDLFSFVLELMKHNAEDMQRKLRRTEPSSPSNSPVR